MNKLPLNTKNKEIFNYIINKKSPAIQKNFAERVYPKHIVRGLQENWETQTIMLRIDNFNETTLVYRPNINFRLVGKTFFSKKHLLRLPFYEKIKFNFILPFTDKISKTIFSFKKQTAYIKNQRENFMRLLWSTNGGYVVCSYGLKGFLPKRQKKALLAKLYNKKWQKISLLNKVRYLFGLFHFRPISLNINCEYPFQDLDIRHRGGIKKSDFSNRKKLFTRTYAKVDLIFIACSETNKKFYTFKLKKKSRLIKKPRTLIEDNDDPEILLFKEFWENPDAMF